MLLCDFERNEHLPISQTGWNPTALDEVHLAKKMTREIRRRTDYRDTGLDLGGGYAG